MPNNCRCVDAVNAKAAVVPLSESLLPGGDGFPVVQALGTDTEPDLIVGAQHGFLRMDAHRKKTGEASSNTSSSD